jgi:hypothetical protein
MEELTDLSDKIELLIGFRTFTVNHESRTSKLYEIVRDEDTGESKQYLSIGSFNNPEKGLSSVFVIYLTPKSRLLRADFLSNIEKAKDGKLELKKEGWGSAFFICLDNQSYRIFDYDEHGKVKELTSKETIDNAVNTALRQYAAAFEEMEIEKKINAYLGQRGLGLKGK